MYEHSRNEQDTKRKILDAAEVVFAGEGYQGASLRAITGLAGVNLAAVNYHFGSKEKLLEAVLGRRLQPQNQLRRRKLDAVMEGARRSGRKPGVREVMRALVESAVRGEGTESRHFIAFVGRSFSDPDDTVRKAFHRFIRPAFRRIHECVAASLPGVPEEVLFWRLQFAIGALARVQHLYRDTSAWPAEMGYMIDEDRLIGMLTAFLAAGMKAEGGPGAGREASAHNLQLEARR